MPLLQVAGRRVQENAHMKIDDNVRSLLVEISTSTKKCNE